MIVTYNWLKEFVDCELAPEELSHRLTMAGLEVDAMERIGEGLDDVVVARLLDVAPHPNADRLTLCRVDAGGETVEVVCGAQNHQAGDLVALARVGAVLPGNFKIKKSKIRGVESRGMLCSEKELGLAEASEGIMILPPGLDLGEPVFVQLGLKDVRFELGLTPNRADCLSVVGVAREVAAMTGNPLRLALPELCEEGPSVDDATSVAIEEPGLCPRYAARLITGVRIGPSPEWLVRRLETIGLRSISNVVDVTNYVMMELGHPLHAFDFRLLREGRIVVKRAEAGQRFTTLDGQERVLTGDDLTICDGRGPVALAGIMGGENSEIQPDTVDILLESAYFNPQTIRRTSKRLGIHSESSHRFERGADVEMVPMALDRAATLIREVAGGKIAAGRIDNYPRPIARRKVVLEGRRVNEILGLELDLLEIRRLLTSIELAAHPLEERPGEALRVEVPTSRPDLEREIDLIEEVARLNGYERIPATMPETRIVCSAPARHLDQARKVREAMVAAGYREIIDYSFFAPAAFDRIRLDPDDPRRRTVPILNPLTEDQSVMRTTLVPGMLETVARNLAYRCRDLRLFELRPVFRARPGEELPEERLQLVAALCGRRAPEGWADVDDPADFFDLKGDFERLLEAFRVPALTWQARPGENFLHPGKSCGLFAADQRVGTLGEVHPGALDTFEIDLPVYLLDVDLEVLFSLAGDFPGVKPLSRYPDVYRDSALLVDETVPAGELLTAIEQVKPAIAEDVVLFDLYRGTGIPEGQKSLAFRVNYRSAEKTLTDEEIQTAHGRIVRTLEEKFGARVR